MDFSLSLVEFLKISVDRVSVDFCLALVNSQLISADGLVEL